MDNKEIKYLYVDCFSQQNSGLFKILTSQIAFEKTENEWNFTDKCSVSKIYF